jgi:hypothetical protein
VYSTSHILVNTIDITAVSLGSRDNLVRVSRNNGRRSAETKCRPLLYYATRSLLLHETNNKGPYEKNTSCDCKTDDSCHPVNVSKHMIKKVTAVN